MGNTPSYIKITPKKVINTWKSKNPELFNKFQELGQKLSTYDCSLYLTGSVAGTEECEMVGDIDIAVFLKDIKDLTQVELETRAYKHLEGTDLTIRFQFYPKSYLNPYKFKPGFNPVYYTALKTINHLIFGTDVLAESNWLEENEVKNYAKMLAIGECMMIFRVINKQKWTPQQNSNVMQKLIDTFLSLMYYKGYFGYSKTEIFSLINQVYSFSNQEIPTLMYEARINKDPEIFTSQEPETLQKNCLAFCQEVLNTLA